jgi:hypothetical protein
MSRSIKKQNKGNKIFGVFDEFLEENGKSST